MHNKARFFAVGVVLVLTLVSTRITRSQTAPAKAIPVMSAKTVLENAANALGGLDRVKSVKNITLIGYGQYAYMFGGGNITASIYAPQKYQAANDLRRVYDFEHDRFQQLERRNFLFPFAAANGHSYAPVNLVLDGNIPYDVLENGNARRVPDSSTGILQLDGVHVRRMWELNNPVALVRAAMDPGTTISNLHKDAGEFVMDLKLKQGDKLSIGISAQSYLPQWIRWSAPQEDLGEVTFTTHLTGYQLYGGLWMPLGYLTTLDWRRIEYFKVWVDTYLVDTKIGDLTAPASVQAPLNPPPPPNLRVVPVAKGIWRLSNGTTVVEFADHLTLFELGGGQTGALAAIDKAKSLVPGKPVTQFIVSHHHFDHTAGFRAGVSQGLTVISRRGNGEIFHEMATHPDPDYPDALAKNPKPLKFIPVDDHLRLQDKIMTLDIYNCINNTHTADCIFAYAPEQKVMIEGDVATAAFDYQFWPDSLMDTIEYYKLDVALISPVHSVWPEHPDVLTLAQAQELVKGGVERARARCASELAKGNYFPGCPIETNRY